MDIKAILKQHKITQQDFANYLGLTREGLNMKINRGEPSQSIVDSLKFIVAEKRGFKIDVNLDLKSVSIQ